MQYRCTASLAISRPHRMAGVSDSVGDAFHDFCLWRYGELGDCVGRKSDPRELYGPAGLWSRDAHGGERKFTSDARAQFIFQRLNAHEGNSCPSQFDREGFLVPRLIAGMGKISRPPCNHDHSIHQIAALKINSAKTFETVTPHLSEEQNSSRRLIIFSFVQEVAPCQVRR